MYCVNCGRKLEEGETCTCRQDETLKMQPETRVNEPSGTESQEKSKLKGHSLNLESSLLISPLIFQKKWNG